MGRLTLIQFPTRNFPKYQSTRISEEQDLGSITHFSLAPARCSLMTNHDDPSEVDLPTNGIQEFNLSDVHIFTLYIFTLCN